MKGAFLPYFVLALTAAAIAIPTDGHAFFKRLFSEKQSNVPQGEERARMEAEADAKLAEAAAIAESGNQKAATKAYRKIVEDYPLAAAAPIAQFQIGDLLRQEGKLEDAFDELQKLVADYRQSPRFEAAVAAQFEIAEAAKAGQKIKFAGIPLKVTTSRIIEMYETVLVNAPFGIMAPQASFSIAEINQDLGRHAEAIVGYQRVVDDYPKSAEARDAQFRIGQISNIIALRSEDVGSIREAQAAMQTFVLENPDAERSADAQAILGSLKKRDLGKDMEVARFYEKTGKLRAAAIYYRDISSLPDSEFRAEARERLANIDEALSLNVIIETDGQPGDPHFFDDPEDNPGIFRKVARGIRVIPDLVVSGVRKPLSAINAPNEDDNSESYSFEVEYQESDDKPEDPDLLEDSESNPGFFRRVTQRIRDIPGAAMRGLQKPSPAIKAPPEDAPQEDTPGISKSKDGTLSHDHDAQATNKRSTSNTASPAKKTSRGTSTDLIKASSRYVGPRAPDLDKLLEKPKPRLTPPSDIVAQDEPPASLPDSSGEVSNILLPPPPDDTTATDDAEEAPLPPAPEEESNLEQPASEAGPGTQG